MGWQEDLQVPLPDVPAFRSPVSGLDELRVACILDELSMEFFRRECQFFPLTPQQWRTEIEAARPDFLFVESAWKGHNKTWYRKLNVVGPEILAILDWCRRKGIPTAFWNKEDPIHFATWFNLARHFDFIFTTDNDCVPLYRTLMRRERVQFLPFASPARMLTPFAKYRREKKFCFAGSYYARQKERQEDFDRMMEPMEAIGDIVIYDRETYPGNPDYMFPERYRRYIAGSLPIDRIDVAYKQYEFGVTLNTIKYSSGMFARRAFELFTCGTAVVSNPCRGLKVMFGDLVIMDDDPARFRSKLEAAWNDDAHRRKVVLQALRKTLREHTYTDRVDFIFRTLFGHGLVRPLPSVCVFARLPRPEAVEAFLENLARQETQPADALLLCPSHAVEAVRSALAAALGEETGTSGPRMTVRSEEGLAPGFLEGLSRADGFACMDPANYYGRHYLTDLVLATRLDTVPVLGKEAFYRWTESGPAYEEGRGRYRYVDSLRLDRCLFARHLSILVTPDLLQDSDPVLEGPACLTLDEFNFCKGLSGDTSSCPEADGPDLDEGAALSDMVRDCLRSGPDVVGEKVRIPWRSLAQSVKPPATARIREEEGCFSLTSRSVAQHRIPLELRLDPETAMDGHRRISIHPEGLSRGRIDLVVDCEDPDEQRLLTQVVPIGGLREFSIPEGTASLRFSFRVQGACQAVLGDLVLSPYSRYRFGSGDAT